MRKGFISGSLSFVLPAGCGALALAVAGCPIVIDGGSGEGGATSTGGGAAGAAGGTTGGGGAGGGMCPATEPSFDGSDACAPEGLHCDYGEECCANNCYASYGCDCSGGTWSCFYTDACLNPGCDPGAANIDDDHDGYTEEQGDCNDCDESANPGAAEVLAEVDPNNPNAPPPAPADEDCDGKIDADDPDLQTCDDGLALDSDSPMDAVKAIGMCDVDANGAPKFLTKATWVLADGTPPGPNVDMAKYHLGHGLVDHFGTNDLPQEGKRMLALSSGAARNKDEVGFVSRNFDKGYSSLPPLTFTGESPACPGSAVPKESVQDAAGLELEIEPPTNAHSVSFQIHYRTYDFPQYICTTYNDFFWANFVQGNVDKNLSFDGDGNAISVNAKLFTQCDCPPAGPGMCALAGQANAYDCQGHELLDGTDFDGSTNPQPTFSGWTNAGTSWLVTTAPVSPNVPMKLRFVVFDGGVTNQGQGDHNLDSMVTIDAFRWHAVSAPAQTTKK